MTLHVEAAAAESNGANPTTVTVGGPNGNSNFLVVSQGGDAETSLKAFAGSEVTLTYVPAQIDQIYITKDTDGDGFLDSIEQATRTQTTRVPSATGETADFELDPTSADTDGDGLADNEEVDLSGAVDGDSASVTVGGGRSNPAAADTDGDTLTDGVELQYRLDPLAVDTDGDGPSVRTPRRSTHYHDENRRPPRRSEG